MMKICILLLVLCVNTLRVKGITCRWQTELDCVIVCPTGENSNSISGSVQSVYNELTDCHATGVKLIIHFDNLGYKFKSNWLQVNIHLIELQVDAAQFNEFEENIFASSTFSTVKRLTLTNFRLRDSFIDYPIPKSMFIGLDVLEDLMITDSSVMIYDSEWLDNVSKTIKSLLVTGSGQERPVIIEKVTGGQYLEILSNLQHVKIHYLLGSIDAKSFTAIPNVRELDLSDCSLSVIGDFTFDQIGSQLQLLNLERNLLKTLPSNIFANLQLRSTPPLESEEIKLSIRSNENQWHCVCALEHLKNLLNANTNFDGEALCKTPTQIENYPIREAVFCPNPVATTTTTTTTTTVAPPIDNENEKECPSHNDAQRKIKISIQPQKQQIRLNATPDGVSVMLDEQSKDLIIIWTKSGKFANDTVHYYENVNVSHCLANVTNSILINHLETDTSYTFCLMNISQPAVSPLDCISYFNRGEQNPIWLYTSNKPLTILVVLVCIGNIIGIIISAIFLKFTKYERFSFRFSLQFWRDPKSETINFNKNLSNDRAPLLPPHPLRDLRDDEVYYATVK